MSSARSSKYGFYSKDDLFVYKMSTDGYKDSQGQSMRDHNFFDREDRFWHVLMSWLLIGVFMLVSLFILLVILSFRAFLMTVAYGLPPDWGIANWNFATRFLYSWRLTVASSIAVFFSSGWTIASNALGRLLAEWRTNVENHRTHGDHEKAQLYKKFAIIFINSYGALLYIAFLKATPAGEVPNDREART